MEKKITKNKDSVLSKSDPSIAFMVSDRVQLKHVRTLECSAKLVAFPKDGTNDYEVTASTRFQQDRENNALFVFVTMGLYSVAEGGNELAKITSEFLLLYEVTEWNDLTDEHFAIFADYNGVFNAWSYWREMVQSMISRLQLPPLTLPTYRFGVLLPSVPTITKKKITKKKVAKTVAKKKITKKRTAKQKATKKNT